MVPIMTLGYTVRFLTPAFLGDAEQHGRWRTPPFKALLRQWWRVVYAADHNFNVNIREMRHEEGLLFGNAWLDNEFRKSLVRMRLDRMGTRHLEKLEWPGAIPCHTSRSATDRLQGWSPCLFGLWSA